MVATVYSHFYFFPDLNKHIKEHSVFKAQKKS